MKTIISLFLVFCCLNLSATLITGVATVNGKTVYTEKHNVTYNEKLMYETMDSDYLDNTNKKFLNIKSDFKNSFYVSNGRVEDLKKKVVEVISVDANKKNMFIEKTENGKTYKLKMPLETDAVGNLGFHNYIVAHFDKLKNEGGDVYFINTQKLDQFKFNIVTTKKENGKVTFKVDPDNLIFRAFIPSMFLTYDEKTKRVLSFEGQSNIEGDDGKPAKVLINYTYN
jgi:hypothetical protein